MSRLLTENGVKKVQKELMRISCSHQHSVSRALESFSDIIYYEASKGHKLTIMRKQSGIDPFVFWTGNTWSSFDKFIYMNSNFIFSEEGCVLFLVQDLTSHFIIEKNKEE